MCLFEDVQPSDPLKFLLLNLPFGCRVLLEVSQGSPHHWSGLSTSGFIRIKQITRTVGSGLILVRKWPWILDNKCASLWRIQVILGRVSRPPGYTWLHSRAGADGDPHGMNLQPHQIQKCSSGRDVATSPAPARAPHPRHRIWSCWCLCWPCSGAWGAQLK